MGPVRPRDLQALEMPRPELLPGCSLVPAPGDAAGLSGVTLLDCGLWVRWTFTKNLLLKSEDLQGTKSSSSLLSGGEASVLLAS